MRLRILLLFVLAAAAAASATTYTGCSGTGTRNWHTTTDWTPNGTPGFGDTVTIQSACVMQCEAGQSCNLGTSASGSGSTDLTVASGGALKVLAGATFTMRGDVAEKGEFDIFGGTFILDPGGAGDSRNYVVNTEGGGSPLMQVCAEATCTTATGTLGILNCGKGSSSTCQINHGAAFSGQIPGVKHWHGAITNFGSSTLAAVNFNDGQTPASIGWISGGNSLFDNDGAVIMGWNSGSLAMTFDGVSFTRPQDVSAGGNGYEFLELTNSTTTSGDRTFRVTASSYPSSHNYQANINVPGMVGGDSTHPGLIGYNVVPRLGAKTGDAFQNVLSVIDRAPGPGSVSASALLPSRTCADSFADLIMLNHTANQHNIVGTNNTCTSSTANIYARMIFDGDGYRASDAGDDYQDLGQYTATNGLHINYSGTLFTFSVASAETLTLGHETAYNDFGGSLGELACYAGGFLFQANSLFVLPAAPGSNDSAGNDGLHTSHSYTRTCRQTATSLNTDYDFYWQMPGSGDAGAAAAKNTFIQLLQGSAVSWPGVPTSESNIVTGQVPTVSGTSITGCTSCFTNAQAKDYVVDTSRTPNTYAVIQTVGSSSAVTLYAAIPSYVAGDSLDVRPGYFSSGGLYGTDWGAHDAHVNPYFQDSTRSVCSWWKKQVSSTVNCSWPSGGDLVATSGTGTTTINDTSVNFSTLGVVDNVDVVAVYDTTFNTFRGSSLVTGHTSTSLTLGTSLSGTTSGDHFTFITAAYNLGQSAVQLYGFDVTGASVTPPAWVKSTIVKDIESYLFAGFAPTNPKLFHAGSDGQTVGCCEFIPPNGGVVISQ